MEVYRRTTGDSHSPEVHINVKWLKPDNPNNYQIIQLRFTWEAIDDFKTEFGADAMGVMVDGVIESYKNEKKRGKDTVTGK